MITFKNIHRATNLTKSIEPRIKINSIFLRNSKDFKGTVKKK